jgi:hypothetical protein
LKITKNIIQKTKKSIFLMRQKLPFKGLFFRVETHKKQPFQKTDMEADKDKITFFTQKLLKRIGVNIIIRHKETCKPAFSFLNKQT